jgi:molybdopterin molybdotransferase
MADPIEIEEARRRVLAEVQPLGSEEVPLERALGRVLAEDVESPIAVPPFDSSAMDGYAVAAGQARELRVIDESRAGHPAASRVEPGTAVRVATGAVVPAGADAVVAVEQAEVAGDAVRVPVAPAGQNVRKAGEDVRAGDVVLRAGTVVGPAEAGVAASVGRSMLRCAARPRAALLLTGDELTQPGEPLAPGRIYSSNGYALAAQLAQAGADLALRDTVPDTLAAMRAALERALGDVDVVCLSGGVSVGPHDHVKDALRALDVEERFWGVRLKPGKPTWFGVRGPVLAFGLPGNPVSAMVTFQLFVRPALAALQGGDAAARSATATLDEPVPRNPRREEAVRVRLTPRDDGWHARPTGEQGSHMLTSMLGADALAIVPAGAGEASAGERVRIELL